MITVSVRKRTNTWEYRIYFGIVDGKPKRVSKCGFKSKAEALRAGNERVRQQRNQSNTLQVAGKMSYAAFLDFWLQNYCQVNLKETTVHDYGKRISNVIKPRLGHFLLSELTPMILQAFMNDIFNAGYSRNALSSVKGIITGSLRYAVSPAGFLQGSPATVLQLPHFRAKPKVRSRKKVREPITVDDWIRLMNRFPREHPSHIPLNLGYRLGLRLGEAFGLCWEDIDFEKGQITIQRQVQYNDVKKCWYLTDPKYESIRTITADDQLIEILRDERERQQKAESYYGKRYKRIYVDDDLCFADKGERIFPVCIREDGSYIQPRTMQHTMYVAHTELNLPLMDYHTLRHTHATILIEAGANMLDVKQRLGHSKLEITQRYTHNTDAIRKRTTGLLNSVFVTQEKLTRFDK